jgi:hypothetical protein
MREVLQQGSSDVRRWQLASSAGASPEGAESDSGSERGEESDSDGDIPTAPAAGAVHGARRVGGLAAACAGMLAPARRHPPNKNCKQNPKPFLKFTINSFEDIENGTELLKNL